MGVEKCTGRGCTCQACPGQVLEFLTVTSLPYRGVNDEEVRRIVRSHAIRDANRRKRLRAAPEPKKIGAGDTPAPPPQSSFTTKFKLSKLPRCQKQVRRYKDQDACGLFQIPSMHPCGPALSYALGVGIWDPFDTLAIKLGPRQQALLDYQKSYLAQSAFTIGDKESLFSAASTDPAWMNAVLCLISLHHDLEVGKGISQDSFYHRAEALRIVNQRLIKSPQHVSEETIGAIACLANFDTTNGFFTGASIHVNGLVEIISNRGWQVDGLFPLDNMSLQKIVAWSELSYCTTWDRSPRFPLITTGNCSESISVFVFFFQQLFPPGTQFHSRHDLVGEMTDIFQTMRLLSIWVRTPPSEITERKMFDRGLYISEYKLLVVLDHPDDGNGEMVVPNRNSHIYGSCRLAAYLYLYIALREIPSSAVINQTIVRRLRGILESACADLLILWRDDQHLFLWILYMGALTSLEARGREFFVKVLRRMVVRMGLDTMEAFTGAVKGVLWERGFCERESTTGVLWKELQQ